MKWYNFIAAFFAGAFIVNFIPHFVNGVSGNFFPTPFANPPGKGLSPPVINVLWALLNGMVGYLLFRAGHVKEANKWSVILFLLGAIAISIRLSMVLADKHQG